MQSPVLCSLLCLEIWHHWSLQSLCCSPVFLRASQPEWQAVRFFPVFLTKPYDTSGKETKLGILVTMVPAAVIILFISSPFQGLIYSQMLLAVQLPITIFTQICLTSSKRVMGRYANSRRLNIVLWITALTVTFLNIGLFITGFSILLL